MAPGRRPQGATPRLSLEEALNPVLQYNRQFNCKIPNNTRGDRSIGENVDKEAIRNSNHREHYLGHSLLAPHGRSESKRDPNWWARNKAAEEAADIEKEKREANLRERREMNRQMGYPEDYGLESLLNPNLIANVAPVGAPANPNSVKVASKDGKERHRHRSHHHRHHSRSRSPRRHRRERDDSPHERRQRSYYGSRRDRSRSRSPERRHRSRRDHPEEARERRSYRQPDRREEDRERRPRRDYPEERRDQRSSRDYSGHREDNRDRRPHRDDTRSRSPGRRERRYSSDRY